MTDEPRRNSQTATIGLLLLFAGSLIPLLLYGPLGDWQTHAQELKSRFEALGLAGPAVFTLVATLLIAVGTPRLILCALGGWLLGFFWGLLCSQLGTMFGEYLTFLFARLTAKEYLLSTFPQLRSLAARTRGTGWRSVVLLRQMPISGLYNDFLLALSPVSHRDFWIGSALGFLPLGVTATLVGAGVMQTDLTQLGHYLALAAAAFCLLTFSWSRIVAVAKRQQAS